MEGSDGRRKEKKKGKKGKRKRTNGWHTATIYKDAPRGLSIVYIIKNNK